MENFSLWHMIAAYSAGVGIGLWMAYLATSSHNELLIRDFKNDKKMQ